MVVPVSVVVAEKVMQSIEEQALGTIVSMSELTAKHSLSGYVTLTIRSVLSTKTKWTNSTNT